MDNFNNMSDQELAKFITDATERGVDIEEDLIPVMKSMSSAASKYAKLWAKNYKYMDERSREND